MLQFNRTNEDKENKYDIATFKETRKQDSPDR